MAPILDVIIRSSIIYLCIVLGIRLFGKREIAQLSIIDLVFILLISNAVQNAMVGDNTTVWGGIIAGGTLFILHYLLQTLFFKSRKLSELIQGDPIMLIYSGKVLHKHLTKAKISMDELEAAVREHGVQSIADVNLAVLETDGNISVLSEDYHHKTTKHRHGHKVIEQLS